MPGKKRKVKELDDTELRRLELQFSHALSEINEEIRSRAATKDPGPDIIDVAQSRLDELSITEETRNG
jgi:hypothetical protein